MKTKIFLFLALFLFAGYYGVNAQAIKAHQKVERHRIHNGVKSGEVTKGEQKVLNSRMHDVRQDAKMAKSDGKVTKTERKMIAKEQKRNSKMIYKAKHNNRKKS